MAHLKNLKRGVAVVGWTRVGHNFLIQSCQEAEKSSVGLCGRKIEVEGVEPKTSGGDK